GAWVSELMPWTAKMVDELCFIKWLHTEAINHDPAITFFQNGSQLAGRPSMGAWLSYGLGSANENLPAFVVLISKDRIDQPLYARLWGNGFLPSIHQGVQFRASKDPVLYLQSPDGVSGPARRKMLDRLAELQRIQFEDLGDPEINARVAQYQTRDIDRACYALVTDLKRRGMLDDTLVVWGGEFGRTNYSQGKLTATDYGRDHHPRCFTMWMAGGGVRAGHTHGSTDDFGYNV